MKKLTKFLYLLILSSLSFSLCGCGGISSLPDAPKAPVSLTLKVLSHSSIELTWLDQAENEAGFRVYREREGGSFYRIANLEPDTERYVDTNLDPETEYSYEVACYNLGGESRSATVTGKTEKKVEVKVQVSLESVILVYNNHVGNEWSTYTEVEDQEITKNKNFEKIYEKKTITLKFYAKAVEDDTVPDIGSTTRYVDLDLQSTTSKIVTLDVIVKENRGRYSGNTAKWRFSYRVTVQDI